VSESCPRCAAPLAGLALCPRCLLAAELPPATLGAALELGEELGRGGMGAVYRARHLGLGRTVAVKLLPAARAAEPEFRRRFEREARALAMLNHPHIVAVHDCGQADGQPYIVMEYVDGQPLSALLPLPPARAAAVVAEVCEALAYAHARGIVHRDIKPANVLLDGDGRVKVADFGIARLIDSEAPGWAITAADRAAGTPHYQAPEALAGAAPDARMDIYAAGVLLYETITGRPPLGAFAPLPGALDAVVRRALAPDPAQRFADAQAMRRALLAASPATPAPAGDALPAEERTWIYAVAMLQAISTAVALWAFLVSLTPRVVRSDEVLPLIMVPGERLADGRMASWARFETWPVLAALATFALAIAAYGALRWHWRRAGLERHAPDTPVREARWVLACGLLSCATYAAGKGLSWDSRPVATYLPVIGGVIEIAALFILWVSILHAWRVGRPLWREPIMWLGFGLAILPPVSEFLIYLRHWTPT